MASQQTPRHNSVKRKPSTENKALNGLQYYPNEREFRWVPRFLSENLLDGENDDEIEAETPFKHVRPLQTSRHVAADGAGRLVIAIDYGTTFTGVTFAIPRSHVAHLGDVQIIQDWGGDGDNQGKIPSIISFSPSSKQQWGANISGDSVTMVNTKLELDVQDNRVDELELILQLLDGTRNLSIESVKKANGLPEYTYKTPEEITTDHLTEVFKRVALYLDKNGAGSGLKEEIAVDIVITVPVKWSYRAKDSTLKAVRQAGFNNKTFPRLGDMILVTEPEAAALYTARHLKEDKNTDFLKMGQCFVLCDAGGGTVDCISYQVTQLEPALGLKEISFATSEKCGSSFIDANFKSWLRSLLGKHYKLLDPRTTGRHHSTSEGGLMRALMKEFDTKKRAFVSRRSEEPHADVTIDLPPGPLHKFHLSSRIRDGELIITHNEMKRFFDPCVDSVIQLIEGQVGQVERTKHRVQNVFLVGGFAESLYLQDELMKSLELRKVKMWKPDKFKAWTAVVQGAVIYGIEKATHGKLTTMSTCARSYGVTFDEPYIPTKYDKKDQFRDPHTDCKMAQEQITWLTRRGDLILSDGEKETEIEFYHNFQDTAEKKFLFSVYEYPDDDDNIPERFATGKNELKEAAILSCDLSTISLSQFDPYHHPQKRRKFYSAQLTCKAILSSSGLEVSIKFKGNQICTTKIKIEHEDNFSTDYEEPQVSPIDKHGSHSSSDMYWEPDRPQEHVPSRHESTHSGSHQSNSSKLVTRGSVRHDTTRRPSQRRPESTVSIPNLETVHPSNYHPTRQVSRRDREEDRIAPLKTKPYVKKEEKEQKAVVVEEEEEEEEEESIWKPRRREVHPTYFTPDRKYAQANLAQRRSPSPPPNFVLVTERKGSDGEEVGRNDSAVASSRKVRAEDARGDGAFMAELSAEGWSF